METRWYGGITKNESEYHDSTNIEVQLTGTRRTHSPRHKSQDEKKQPFEESNHDGIRIRSLALFGTASVSNFFIFLSLQFAWNSKEISITQTTTYLQLFASISTFILLTQILEFYVFSQGFKNALRSPWMWLEILVSILHSPPLYIFQNDIRYGLLACLRVYHIIRPLHQYSPVFNMQWDSESEFDEPQLDISFSLRILILEFPFKVLILFGTVIFFLFSYCIYVQERQRDPSVFTFGFSLWYTLMCMTTVGNVQQIDVDPIGKLLSSASTIAGIFMFCMTLVLLHRKLVYSPEERELVDDWKRRTQQKFDEISSLDQSGFFADIDRNSSSKNISRRSIYGKRY